jgi:hypothetical protein
MVLCASFVMLMSLSFWGNAGRMVRYDNPLVIMEGVCLIFAFQKWHFQSKLINWLAASCFAVYIIHFNPYLFGYYLKGARVIREMYTGIGYPFFILLYLVAVYLICVLIDQLRIFSWRILPSDNNLIR